MTHGVGGAINDAHAPTSDFVAQFITASGSEEMAAVELELQLVTAESANDWAVAVSATDIVGS